MSTVDPVSDLSPTPKTLYRVTAVAENANDRATSIITPHARRFSANGEASAPRVSGYDILSLIGCGGMGIVYKARQRALNRIVALKTLRGPAIADDETRVRFQSEAEAVARLQHPNIVQVFEVGSVESLESHCPNPFIALEFVDGGSLVQKTRQPQLPRDAALMVVKLARAVEAAHRFGIVHRDLKPANVLLTRNGEPKIADFGLAKQISSETDTSGRFLTQAGLVVGTPEYMSPEQAAGAAPSTAVDIYALGIILYELLTARVPFQGANPVETMDLARHQDALSPRQLQPNIPRDLDTICMKCLEKDPSRRYRSADALADDLQRFVDHRPILARRVSTIGKVRRWCRRNPVASLSVMCVAAIFLSAFGFVTRSYWRAEDAREDALQKAHAERLENYYANIAASASALQVFNVDSARRTLDAAPKEHRKWEWRHFQSRLDLTAHVSEAVNPLYGHVGFSPSGNLALRSLPDAHYSFWDVTQRREVGNLRLNANFALCNDEQMVALMQADQSVALIDIATGKTRTVLPGHTQPILSVNASGDGKRLVTWTADRKVWLWNASDGRLLQNFTAKSDIHFGVRISHDGRWLAGDQDERKSLAVWEAETGKQVALLTGHVSEILGTNFSFRGDRLLTVEGFPANLGRLWETSTGRLIATLPGHRNTVTCSEFSPDGSHFATGSLDQMVRVWNSETGQMVALLRGHLGQINSVSFRADGKRLASASHDHTIRVWDVPTGDLLTVLPGNTCEVSSVHFLQDGGIVSASQAGAIRLWDARTVEGDGVLRGHTSFVYGIAVHPDSNRVASASWDATARIWDATTGKQLATLHHGDKAIVTSVAFHPDGEIVASRSRDSVRLWDVASGKELQRWKVASGGWKDTRLAFNPQGTLLASGCGPMEVRLWDVTRHEEVALLRGHMDEVRDVAFSPDGQFLAVAADGGDKRVHIWDVARHERVAILEGHNSGCYGVAFSRDGSLLASSSADSTVRLWSTATWKELAVLKHNVSIYGVAFSADGSRLVSACADSSMRFWDVKTHREVAELRGDNQYYHQVAFSPDGSRLVGACGDCTVRIWDTFGARDRAALNQSPLPAKVSNAD